VRPRLLSPITLFLLFAVPSGLRGQAPSTQDTTRLHDVVVTATRAEEPRRGVPATVTVVSGAELRERGFRFVLDWLREVPGVAVVPTGSFGGVTSLFVRGGESDYTKVLVDGVAVNLPGGSVDLANLTTDNVERIEVLRGPGSVLYGSDAVTGVVQILTRRGSGRVRVNALARAGSFGTADLRLGASGGTHRVSWSGQASRFASDGIYAFNNGYRSWVTSGRLGFRPDERTDLAAAIRFGDHRLHFPTDFVGVPSDSNQLNTEEGITVSVDGGRRLGGGDLLELRVLGSLHRADFGFEDASDNTADTTGFGYAATRDSRIRRRLLDLRAIVTPASRLRVSTGLEASAESERQLSSTTSNFGGGSGSFTEEAEFDKDRSNLAAYAQARAGLARAVDLHAGLRYDDNEVFGAFTTWRAGIVVLPSSDWRFHAAAGTAFKQPTFSQQFADTPFEVGDPDLDPERVRSWEAGVEASLADGSVTVGVTWFDQRFRDLIQYQGAAPGEPTYANVARASARGLEAGAGVRPVEPLSLGLRWTWLDTEVNEAGPPGLEFLPGERLLRRPTHTVAANGSWRGPGGLLIGGEAIRVGRRDDVDFSSFPATRVVLDAYTVVGGSLDLPITALGVRLDQGWADLALVLRVDNLLDEGYETVVGFPGRGRTLLAGLRLR
jgi:vitamin B12 transporter